MRVSLGRAMYANASACLAGTSIINVMCIGLEQTFDNVDKCGMCTVRLTLDT